MTAISVTGPGEEPAPIPHENDDPARKSTDSDIEMHDSDLESQPPPTPSSSLLLPKALRMSLPLANVTEPGTTTRWTSYPLTPLPPPHDDDLVGVAHALLRNRGHRGLRPCTTPPPGSRKSDYMSVEQRPRTRQRQMAAKGKARAGTSTGPSGKKTKKAAKGTVVVVDDEDDEEEESDNFKIPMPPPGRERGGCDPIADETRSYARAPRRKRQRVADEQEQDDSDGSIIVDAPRKRRRHRTSTPPAILTSISIHTSTPESTPPPQEQSSPFTPPDVNSLAGLPLTIPSEPARTEIAIPPRCTRRPILQILCANCERRSSTRSGRVFVMRGQRLAVSLQLIPLPNLPPGSDSGGQAFCHYCRSTTRQPKMRCTLIKASTDKRCRNLLCDRRIEKRYPELTFDSAEDFECPARGSAERRTSPNVMAGGAVGSNNIGTAPAATMTMATTTDAQVFDARWSATAVFTVSGEPLGSAFLHGNKARIVPVS
ncbi:hypothetical protein EDB85DRAFT_2140230 [Lactarius pseudohatsudake]|nr:hypothetical protein EDB85DRAFT_2140230 [Lactarius pseudohatsudake]